MIHLKTSRRTAETGASDVSATVAALLAAIESDGEAAARRMARDLVGWKGEIVLSGEARARAVASLPEALEDDIRFAHGNIRRLAEAQMTPLGDCGVEILPGLIAGQRRIPVAAAGAYVPGGRYAHVASALLTITTAKVAGVGHVTACSPPHRGADGSGGIPPAIIFAMDLCGADTILNLGGVQGVAAMANGLFGCPRADILVGPGNQYVAEAKRLLIGRVGIDMVAGPTDSMVVADATADAELVAHDPVGQAEHGYNSPVWLVTDDRTLAERVMARVPDIVAVLPERNRASAAAAWTDFAEVMLCDGAEEMAGVADAYAPEHLHVQAADLDWWLRRLRSYGSLFLGRGDDGGPRRQGLWPEPRPADLRRGAPYRGLSVHTFLKVVAWQQATCIGARPLAQATARISRLEGMEGHARSVDVRLAKYFPGETFDLTAPGNPA